MAQVIKPLLGNARITVFSSLKPSHEASISLEGDVPTFVPA